MTRKKWTLRIAMEELLTKLEISSDAHKAILKNVLEQTVEYHLHEYAKGKQQ